ncbi:MAG: carboxypeptidase-like regulatory domain-containing protein [Bacteroidia bacterium]
MGNSVSSTCDTNQDLYQNLPKVDGSVTRHKSNMQLIAKWQQKQEDALNLKALVRDKNLLRIIMEQETLRIISGIKALAADSDPEDTQLAGSVNYSPTKLKKMTDPAFVVTCNKIKEIAEDHSVALVDFGISSQILSGYALDLTAFDSISKKPKSVRGQLKMYTSNLAVAISAMMKHLKSSLDNLIKSNFPSSDFETSYFNSREVYKYGQNATGLIGNLTDTNGHPVKDAIIELLNYPSPGEIAVRSTNSKGHYAYKRLDMSRCTIRIRAIGFTTAEYEIDLIKDEFKRFDIILIAEPAPVTVPA